MKDIRCPYCNKLLFKANFADAEIICKCKKKVRVKQYTYKGLLTAEEKTDTIEIIKS